MKQASATTKYIRVSPKRAKQIASPMRGQPAKSALFQLAQSGTKAGRLLRKTLASAIANAEANHDMRGDKLCIVDLRIDKGPHLKRSKPKNKGGTHPILRRTCHFHVVLEERE